MLCFRAALDVEVSVILLPQSVHGRFTVSLSVVGPNCLANPVIQLLQHLKSTIFLYWGQPYFCTGANHISLLWTTIFLYWGQPYFCTGANHISLLWTTIFLYWGQPYFCTEANHISLLWTTIFLCWGPTIFLYWG
jgi:hypothetical protein